MHKLSYLLFSCWFLHAFPGLSQIDTEFWFAAPEVTEQHADRPIFLRVTTFDQAAEVTVSIPANTALEPATKVIEANSTFTFSLTLWIDELEHKEINQVVNKGLHIESTAPISVYYEVMGKNFLGVINPDIFALKGKNALGTSFFCPFQNHFDNHDYKELTSHSIDIVAIEDHTIVTIIPIKDMIGHSAQIPFNVTLNRGQTYSVKAPTYFAKDKLSGTEIRANHPIAVTLKDDSVEEEGGGNDLVGDQLIPVNMLGTEYVAGEGWTFVLAIEEDTQVKFGTNPSVTLAKQETKMFVISDKTGSFISASKPVYVFHLKNSHGEMGGAILPPVLCTGSKKVSFTRSTTEPFYLTLIVKKGGEQSFTFNGDDTEILAQDFLPVQGNDDWMIYQMPSDFIKPQEIGVVENSQMKFHLGMENGDYAVAGGRYGYFSDFSEFRLPEDSIWTCQGEKLVLDAGTGYDLYQWNTGETTQTIEITKSGTYSVTVSENGEQCIGKDTVDVSIFEYPNLDSLPSLVEFCHFDPIQLTLNAGVDTVDYLWNTGATSNFLSINEAGNYVVTATYKVCTTIDSSQVRQVPEPIIDLGNDVTICRDTPWEITLNEGFDIVKWNTGDTTHHVQYSEKGTYSVHIEAYANTKFCGMDQDTIHIDVWDIHTYNTVTPNEDGINESFVVDGIEKGNWHLAVYNRWGKQVYNNIDYKNDWTPNELNDGLYYFELKEETPCNHYKGWIQVIR